MDIYRLAKGRVTSGIFLVGGSIIFGGALGLFLSPNRLAAGGIAGISVMLDRLYPLGVGTYTMLLNVPLLVISAFVFGRRFVLHTAAAIAVCGLTADRCALLPPLTDDPLLAALFGGAAMGLGCALVFLSGATTGGTDIVTKLILRRFPHLRTGRIFLAADGSVCIAGGIVFQSLETAMYAFIGLFVFSKVLDGVLYGADRSKLVLIVTNKSGELLPLLLSNANVGCTVISVRTGYCKLAADTLMCAMKKHRLHAVRRLVEQTDNEAFMLVLDAGEIYGEGFQPLKARDQM